MIRTKIKMIVPSCSTTGDGKKIANKGNHILLPAPMCKICPQAPPPCVPSVTITDPGQSPNNIDDVKGLGKGCKGICARGGSLSLSDPAQKIFQHDGAGGAGAIAVIAGAVVDAAASGGGNEEKEEKKEKEKKNADEVHKNAAQFRGKAKEYLKDSENITPDQISKTLKEIGLKEYKSPCGKFRSYKNKHGKTRAMIHPPDTNTTYDHLHIIFFFGKEKKAKLAKQFGSLNKKLEKVDFKSLEAHIKLKGD